MNSGKISIIFDTSDVDQRYQLELLLKADDMFSALNEIREYIRDRVKYQDLTPPAQKEIDKMSEEFWEIISDNGLKL